MSDSKHFKIVIVGGGTAGITVAAQLRKKSPTLSIALCDPASKHYYQPLWTLAGAGIVAKEDTERPEKSVIPEGVEWLQQGVLKFTPEENQVHLADGQTLSYDTLVVAPGIQIDWEKVKGLPEALGKGGVCSNYSYDTVDSTWENIRNFKGGKAVFTFPSTPIKCAGAPQKIMYLAEDSFRRKGIRDQCEVTFASAAAGIFGVEKYAKTLRSILSKRDIHTHFKHDLIEVDAERKITVFKNLETTENIELSYDLLHVSPPMSAPDFIKNSALASEAGWVDVDKYSLQHTKFKNVFSLGDASSLPTSKTGAAIRKQAPVLVANLLSYLNQAELTETYNGYTSCPLVTSHNTVVMAEFDYDGKPAETFPIDQSKERWSMYLVKRYLLPKLYWEGMLKGRA